MSDEVDESSSPVGGLDDPWDAPDPLLAMLVNIVNDNDMEIGIRLHTDGFVVSGVLVSAVRHFELLSNQLKPTQDDESADARRALANAYATIAESFSEERKTRRHDEDAEEVDDSPSARYVHLRDAWAHSGGSTLEFGLWRGRLSHVSAWSLGNYGSPSD